MNLHISTVMIISGDGRDEVILFTELPEPCHPYEGELSISFKTAKGAGLQYVKDNFPGVDITVSDFERVRLKFSDPR